MISAGYIGGGVGEPVGPPAPVAPQPPIVKAGEFAVPVKPVDLSALTTTTPNAMGDALVNNFNASAEGMKAASANTAATTKWNGWLGLGNQILQFVDGLFKFHIADRIANLQDSYRTDMRTLEDKRLDNADKLGNRQLDVTETLSKNAKEAEETKARNQRLGAEEIARIQEDGKTKRAALGVTDEDFGRRGYGYGFPV